MTENATLKYIQWIMRFETIEYIKFFVGYIKV